MSLREKQGVSAGSVILALFIMYECIWMPCIHHLENMRLRIASQQKTLVFMQSADAAMRTSKLGAKHPPATLVVFMSQMQKQIRQFGLESFLVQFKQAANESVELHFQKVEFDKLMVFLTAAMKDYPVSVSQMMVVAQDTPGQVNADVVVGQLSGTLHQ